MSNYICGHVVPGCRSVNFIATFCLMKQYAGIESVRNQHATKLNGFERQLSTENKNKNVECLKNLSA